MESTGKGEVVMETEFPSFKENKVREMLVEMGLPSETVEHALKKFHETGGDPNEIATYALNLNIPQAECIEEHLSDDMNSSDEEAGAESVEKWIQPPSGMKSPTVPAPKSDGEEWQDPICHLFQQPHVQKYNLYRECGSSAAGGSVQTTLKPMLTIKEEAGSSDQFLLEKPVKKDIEPPQSSEQRGALFLDMGFPKDLVQRAIRMHGAEAADSILLQFLLDHSENSARPAQPINEEESDSDEEMRARVLAARSLKSGGISTSLPAKKDKSNEDSGYNSGSDSDDAPCDDLEAQASDFANPPPLCSRKVPEDGGHRAQLQTLGFSLDLIERGIEELGAGVEYDMLMEYLLYLSAQQDSQASTSDLIRDKEVSTLEKLTTEFQFPTLAVQKAMDICKTPLWNAKQDEILDVVEFLAAHLENLTEEEESVSVSESDSDDDVEDDIGSIWDWGQVTGKLQKTDNIRGKRKLDDRQLGKGKALVQGGRSKGGVILGGLSKKKSTATVPRLKSTQDSIEITTKYRGAIGFGLPGQPVKPRHLKEDVKGAPFFYFENVAGMPVGEWDRIRRHLFDIEPEFVDAIHFSACRRSRGYIHNLPLEGRRKIIKDPPMTIQELMPQTKPFWPEWDKRTKLNCINTVKASSFMSKRLGLEDGTALQSRPYSIAEQKKHMYWCCKWNLVWTAPNVPSPVEANEIEAMLGFDRDHTRSCFGSTARYKALGNSFSVYTVAYHFSVLKPLFASKGIKVLSLFSGIGGAEVALHKIGIRLSVVVSVEIEEGARRCIETWWATTNQTGILDMSYHDVRDLERETLTELVQKYNGFDLIVGGSPCNNLTGNNRVTRDGLEGKHSTMFFEFSRIVSTVRELTIKLHERR